MEKNIVNEQYLREVLSFIKKCDSDFLEGKFLMDNVTIGSKYLINMKRAAQETKSNVYYVIIEKLSFIINQIHAHNFHNYNKDSILNLGSVSVTNYIIKLVKEKHLIDPILIARFIYIELSKTLYYDISYINQDREHQKMICNAKVDPQKEKIFSYVVCTQFIELYQYILHHFGIKVEIKTKPGQDHVWGEIKINDENILIVDATEYIIDSIDLSNAKANSPTVGFVVLPIKYSGIRIREAFTTEKYQDAKEIIEKNYQNNRDLDIALGYIDKDGYKTEQILNKNDIFKHPKEIIAGQKMLDYLTETVHFFNTLEIPTNMDGYEIRAFYQKFIRELPATVVANIKQETIYVNAHDYKADKMKEKFLHAPNEYLKYLQELVYNRYYKYLSEKEYNTFLEQVKKGVVGVEQLGQDIAAFEMRITEINRKLNLFYAINKLSIFNPLIGEEASIQLYEPMIGNRVFNNIEDYETFSRKLIK